jgi:hypothetical protein
MTVIAKVDIFFSGYTATQWVFERTRLWYNDVIAKVDIFFSGYAATRLRSECLKERDILI